jgi:uncharacterized protein YbjT (DUF2867 family)
MNILVTGGSGFIGTRLIGELLHAGHQVAIYAIAPCPAYPALRIAGDVLSPKDLIAAAAGRDTIVYLAAEHRDDV